MTENPHIEVKPFSNLSHDEISGYKDRANWTVTFPDDTNRGDWLFIEDPKYRVRIEHTQITWGTNVFDKYNILGWGAFILPMRITSEGLAEFCLNNERRILLRDEEGKQGNVFTVNIPQGGITLEESTIEASIREAKEETGIDIKDILLLGRYGFDTANSESIQDLFLGLVGYNTTILDQNMEDTEDLEWKWHTWKEIEKIDILNCQSESALYKAFKVLRPQLIITELAGKFTLDPSFSLTQAESLEWYIKPEIYQSLRGQTIPNYPHI